MIILTYGILSICYFEIQPYEPKIMKNYDTTDDNLPDKQGES